MEELATLRHLSLLNVIANAYINTGHLKHDVYQTTMSYLNVYILY